MNESMIIEFVNFILNKILSLDPQKSYLLQRLQQRSLIVQLNDFGMRFSFTPAQDHLIFDLSDSTRTGDVLSATSGTLIAMALSANPQSYIQKAKATFAGDIYVLEHYRDFFKAIRPDLIYMLTAGQTTSLSSFLAKPLDAIKHWFKISKERLPIEFREYIQYEKELFPCKEEVEDFFTDIQQLKQDIERIAIKLERHLKIQGGSNE